MVLQILAHARQGVDDRHADLGQGLWIPNARQLQDVGRLDSSGTEQNLRLGIDAGPLGLLALGIFNPHGAAIFDQDAGRSRINLCRKIGAYIFDRMQITLGRAPARTVLNGQLIGTKTLLLIAIKICCDLVACLLTRLDEGREDRVWR